MSLDKAATQVYSFDKSVFIKFIGRSDFSVAKYHKLSLYGFSCYCNKEIITGEKLKVEVNLKMITGGAIDDTIPHIALAEMIKTVEVNDKRVYQFKFLEFEDNCLDNLVKALAYLDNKEKIIHIPVASKDVVESVENGSTHEIVAEIVENVRKGEFVLPVLPKIIKEVESVVNNPDSTTEDLAMVIERDAVIAVKVLATANSPFFRASSHIVSLRDTIPRMGFKEIRNLVITIANKSLYHTKARFFKQLLERLWKHSLTCAHCAKQIAVKAGLENADSYYMAGLVHDIGKTLLFRYLSDMLPRDAPYATTDILVSTEKYNIEMGQFILKHWEFSETLIEALKTQDGAEFDETTDKAALVIHTANMLSRNMGYDIVEGAVMLSNLEALQFLDIDLETLGRIGQDVKEMMEHSDNAF